MKHVGFKSPDRHPFGVGLFSWMGILLLIITTGLFGSCAQQPDATTPASSTASPAQVAEETATETTYPKEAMESLYLSCSEGCNSLEMSAVQISCFNACQCVKTNVPVEIPYEDFMAYGQAMRENKPPIGEVDQRIRKIADRCFEQSMSSQNQ